MPPGKPSACAHCTAKPCASDPHLQHLTPVLLLTADQKVVIQNLRESYTHELGRGNNLSIVDQTDVRCRDPILSLFIMEPTENQQTFIIRPASDRWLSFETHDPKKENSLVFLYGRHKGPKPGQTKVYKPCPEETAQHFSLDPTTGFMYPKAGSLELVLGVDGPYIRLMRPLDVRCLKFVIRPVVGDHPGGRIPAANFPTPPGQLVYGPTADPASNDPPATKCIKSRQELQEVLQDSNFGSNEAMFNAYFMRKAGIPSILCALCEQTISAHVLAPPSESANEVVFFV